MSNPTELGLYSTLPETLKKRSGGTPDVPVDPVTKKFAQGYIERTVDQQISDVRGQIAYRDRVDGRELMLVNAYRESPCLDTRVGGFKRDSKGRRIRRKTVTAKERRLLKLFEIPEDKQKYALFEPLNCMWNQYMAQLLSVGQIKGPETLFRGDLKQRQNMMGRVVKADLHGAMMEVVRSKCPNFVGIRGIVAQETKNTFRMVTADDRLATVPKAKTAFSVVFADGSQCTVFGDQFAFRASERAAKKFKPKPTVDIN
ncbi:RNase P/RNase MRP complex subunit [Coemansia sp. IMI 203386]|nr:RNase P/RNase MRP complex subunit [Coemansia sp. IMI 203386]